MDGVTSNRRAAADAVVLDLPSLVAGIPAPPDPSLDPYLDAAARCFARHGVSRCSVQDIAADLKVSRATVYRQIGNVEAAVRLLLARELHRLLSEMPSVLAPPLGPQTIIDLVAGIVTFARHHPVLEKVLRDEPELIGPFLVTDLDELIGRVVGAVAPLLSSAMDAGWLARRDPDVVADWLVRLAISLVLAPPKGPLADHLGELLVPALTPEVTS
ncbi:MAG TPA: TetR/AcrR family transcriptional regulator [Acidimicrobiales bacterium]|nr:TetR/AcrR family transcriptional regulator [Acidimicrobiales bacterium]